MPLEISKVFPDPQKNDSSAAARRPAPAAEPAKRGSIYEVAVARAELSPARAVEPAPRKPEPARPTVARAAPAPATARAPRPAKAPTADPGNGATARPARPSEESQEGAALDPRRPRKRVSRRDRRHDGEAARASAESARLESARLEPVPEDGDFGGKFRQFAISAPVLKAIDEMGWREPSEIQQLVIPVALTGRDVVGQAKTGTGKTGAFAIPTVERFRNRADAGERGRPPVVLVLAPTRELAVQVHDQIEHLAAHTPVRSVAIYGGAPMEPQLRALRAGCDVVVGTPGRVMDHVRRGTLRLHRIASLILDEADRMFDLGFRDDIYWISRRLPHEGRQTLLLSATMPDEVLKLAEEVTKDPELIYTAPEGTDLTVSTVEQFYIPVDPERKLDLLVRLLEDEKPEKGMVFTRTKRGADKVAEKLRQRGLDAGEIHGDLKQKRREQILESFREGGLRLMVCTDVAARGLDIQGVTHIFNFDVPENPEDYVHRVGRTARMGKRGRAFTFVTREDGDPVTQIEKLINKEIPRFVVEGFRTQANEEERAASTLSKAAALADHPLAKKLSPALLAILNERRGRGGPRPAPRAGRAAPRGGGRDRGGRDRGRGGRGR